MSRPDYYRCVDVECGWTGLESDLGERVRGDTWVLTKPHADMESCCPQCYADIVSGAWCMFCESAPATDHCELCADCFKDVTHTDERRRAAKLARAVALYHRCMQLWAELRNLRARAKQRQTPGHQRRELEARAVAIGSELQMRSQEYRQVHGQEPLQ